MSLMKIWTTHRVLSRCVRHVTETGLLPALLPQRPARSPGPACGLHQHTALMNSNRTAIVRCGRQKYERLYPVLLVRPDGSSINIRYKEPRRILMMPVDLSTLSEEDRKARQKKREVKRTVKRTTEVYEDDFKADDYSQFWKKK